VRAVRYGPGGVELVDVEPARPGDGLVEVAVAAAGICGTDLTLGPLGMLPAVPGHEIAGRLPDGTPVAIEPLDGCGGCDCCTRGDYHLCRTGASRMLGIGADGGMAERVLARGDMVTRLPAGLAPEDASLVEPLAVAVHGLRIAGLEPGQRVAVVGGGTIGLCAAAATLALAGTDAGAVALEARHEHQRLAAEALGASTSLQGQFDLVVEAAGSESAVERGLHLVRPGGTLLVLSMHVGVFPMQFLPAMMKEVRIVTSLTYNRHAGGRDFDSAAALLAARPEIASILITHRFPLEESRAAFAVAADRSSGAIKVVIEPGG